MFEPGGGRGPFVPTGGGRLEGVLATVKCIVQRLGFAIPIAARTASRTGEKALS
jgi:hypothetical protein